MIADLHAERYGIHTISFRLSNPYGPHDSTDPRKAHVLPAFVMRALAPGERFEIKGNPLVERDFIYVGDVVDVFTRSLEMRETSDALNLCRGETTTLLDLARTILEVAGEDRPVHAPDTATSRRARPPLDQPAAAGALRAVELYGTRGRAAADDRVVSRGLSRGG